MHNFFIEENQLNKDIRIHGTDVNHIKNVLRLQPADKICVHIKNSTDKYICELAELTESEIICNIIEKLTENKESDIYINIVQALPKSDKMELIIQKCTELGVREFTPLALNRCIVKINPKDEQKKIARWQNIAEVAAKQCSRDIIPQVNNIYSINNINELLKDYDLVIIAYENEELNTLKNAITQKAKKIAIIIGPEGGIEEKEVEKLEQYGYKSVTLGKRILRTETVAIVLSSIMLYTLGDLGGN